MLNPARCNRTSFAATVHGQLLSSVKQQNFNHSFCTILWGVTDFSWFSFYCLGWYWHWLGMAHKTLVIKWVCPSPDRPWSRDHCLKNACFNKHQTTSRFLWSHKKNCGLLGCLFLWVTSEFQSIHQILFNIGLSWWTALSCFCMFFLFFPIFFPLVFPFKFVGKKPSSNPWHCHPAC